jgi:RNA polymerase sigma factor (sigma-70 family)
MLPSTHHSILEELRANGTRPEAFERFCQLYRQPLLACCRGKGSLQEADAEDVAQKILLSLWQALCRGSFGYDPNKGTFRGYLTGVVDRAIADHFRELKRHPPPKAVGGDTGQELINQKEAPPNGREDAVASSVAGSSCAEEWEAITRVRARVDEQSWKCFWLRHVQGWDVKDVARETGKRTGAVSQATYRIRVMINEEYQLVQAQRGPPPEGRHP